MTTIMLAPWPMFRAEVLPKTLSLEPPPLTLNWAGGETMTPLILIRAPSSNPLPLIVRTPSTSSKAALIIWGPPPPPCCSSDCMLGKKSENLPNNAWFSILHLGFAVPQLRTPIKWFPLLSIDHSADPLDPSSVMPEDQFTR